MEKRKDHGFEVLDIIMTKNWDKARQCNDKNLYQYIKYHKDTDENCRIIWEHVKIYRNKNHGFEVLDIIKTKDWDRARSLNNKGLYQYIYRHKDSDKNCMTIYNHIKTGDSDSDRDYKSEILDIIKTKDWNRARGKNDKCLYSYVHNHRDTDENCRIIWEHVSQQIDYNSVILDIIKTKDWNRARWPKNRSLYGHIRYNKDKDKNCKIVWDHVTAKRRFYTIKDYLLCYFEYGKPSGRNNGSLYQWFIREIKRGNQCCIDIKNLIIAAEKFQDSVALETLELIKKHLEEEEG